MLPIAVIVVLAVLAGTAIGYWIRNLSSRSEIAAKSALVESVATQLADREDQLRQATQKAESFGVEKARLEERLTAEQESLKQARAALEESFRSAASRVLNENSQAFLQLARQELGQQQQTASNELEQKEQAIENLLKPVRETLDKLQKDTQQLEVKREGAYQSLKQMVEGMQTSQADLKRETSQLVSALRAPKVRGNWGELQLKRCIEFAGMVEHASFDTEVFVRGEENSIRPDCVIHLPNERTIVIDVKTPFDAFLEAMNAPDEATRELNLAAHARRVREHLAALAAKSYWKQFKDSPDFVVCFLSSEVLFSAALEQDPGLIEFGSTSNVILATPTTLIALLKAVAYGWQQMEITKNAQAIQKVGENLYNKLATAQDYFTKMGTALGNAVKHYNSLVGCVEGRGSVFTYARKLHELQIGQDELPEIGMLESVTRELTAEDWKTEEKQEEPDKTLFPEN
ncbi:MAG TPA: DNA recombination protein RmuC [Pseudacidobacterium sp.]|nr:DNA recombination protein RmuC [Pseudacidobacterium sp.]